MWKWYVRGTVNSKIEKNK
uniref:Uncharacterized protein n=1 Tax=Anguilla anguilla TaxID=7936 RepID=A0A0E9VAC7_ANGAN